MITQEKDRIECEIRLIRNLPTMCEFTDAYGEPIDSDAYYEAVDMAISALEKQIPQKVIPQSNRYGKGTMVYYTYLCQRCGYHIRIYELKSYCPYCGQAIDWEEE